MFALLFSLKRSVHLVRKTLEYAQDAPSRQRQL